MTTSTHVPAFPDMTGHYRLIAFTGGGGKTSLANWIAQSAQAAGKSVIVTTTTKIFPPSGQRTVLEQDGPDFMDRVRAALSESPSVVVAHSLDETTGKLIGLHPDTVCALHRAHMADTILVEADGAARKPFKGPNDFEPVIPCDADLCIAVMGLDAAYKPLDETTVHRPEIVSKITGLPLGEPVHPQDMITVATAPNGLLKKCPPDCDQAIFLNKTDSPGLREVAAEFAALLTTAPPLPARRWFAGSAQARTCTEITPHTPVPHSPAHDRLEFSHKF